MCVKKVKGERLTVKGQRTTDNGQQSTDNGEKLRVLLWYLWFSWYVEFWFRVDSADHGDLHVFSYAVDIILRYLWFLWYVENKLFNLLLFHLSTWLYRDTVGVPCGALMTFILRTAVRPYRLGEYTTAVSETVDRCLLTVDRCLLTGVRCLLTVDRWLLSVVRWLLSVDHCLLSVDRWPP